MVELVTPQPSDGRVLSSVFSSVERFTNGTADSRLLSILSLSFPFGAYFVTLGFRLTVLDRFDSASRNDINLIDSSAFLEKRSEDFVEDLKLA